MQIINPYLKDFHRIETVRSIEPRQELISRYSWAVPTDEAIREVVKYSPLIEIGAGSGYWAHLIKQAKGDIICFDDFSLKYDERWLYSAKTWHRVYEGSVEKIGKYPQHTLLLCWPPYDEPLALDALNAYKGRYLVYIGEGYGGCTGCTDFHDLLYKEWKEITDIYLPQYWGINDYLRILERS